MNEEERTNLARRESAVSVNWKYATLLAGGLLVAQFLWWDAKAPQVLRGGRGYGQ